MELTTFAILLAIMVVGAGMQRITGLGFALVASPFFVLLLNPISGVFLVNVCGVVVAVALTVRSFALVDWRRWGILAASAIIGVIPGALLLLVLPVAWLDILVGALIITGLVSSLLVRSRLSPDHVPPLIAAGALSGAMNVTAGVGGPPLGIYGVLTRWDHRSFAATMQPVFVTIGSMSLAAKLWLSPGGIPNLEPWMWLGVAAACLVGMAIGEVLTRVVTPQVARGLLVALALVGAGTVLVRGILLLIAP
ncbi:sulfite exporter TauE/SafE family protein [Microbacterium sp. EST19A]|uniref:sulfite exporter TauE/SafE family protein n=1 Tax=Microbacterium sp. EST19A TaxID=2862681 RepID=UPI001CBC06EF|nr:sulfite exporter TauE/SafE family protein [Microbacterium sp. EST19A]